MDAPTRWRLWHGQAEPLQPTRRARRAETSFGIHHRQSGRWTRQPAGRGFTNEPLYGVFFANDKKGWAVGRLGPAILNTSNGGQTWDQSAAVDAGGKALYDVFFITAADGWAVGSGAKILHSPDGRVWNGIKTESIQDLKDVLWAVAFASAEEGWAVGDNGTILHIEKAQ